MKEKIFATLMALIVLASTTNLWFSYKVTLKLFTNAKENAKISLSYLEENSNKKTTVEGIANWKGKFILKLTGKRISWFKIVPSKGVVVFAAKYSQWKTKKLTLNARNEYIGTPLKGRFSISLYHFIILGGLGYYFAWFLAHSLKYGFPKDDSGLPKILNFEFLRIVFTFSILWNHFAWRFGFYAHHTYMAVEFFFILSGFLLLLTFRPERTAVDFIKNRWIRFAPLVYFGVVMDLLFERTIDGSKLFADIFFYTRTGLYTENGYNPPSWYVSVLIIVSLFYLYLIKHFKEEVSNLIIAVITVLSSYFVVKYFIIGKAEQIGILNVHQMRGFACIGLGIFVAKIYRIMKDKAVIHQMKYNLMETGVLIYAIFGIFLEGWYAGRAVSCIFFMALILIFALKKGSVSRFFEKPVFAKMANYCLSVYLTHWFFTIIVVDHVLKGNKKDLFLRHDCLSLFGFLLASIFLGVIAHHFVELPARRALKKWLG